MTSGGPEAVPQDEVECAVPNGVEGLAGVGGKDVVRPSPLELSLRREQGEPVLEPERAPCCQLPTTLCRASISVMRWVRGPVSSFMSSWPRAPGW